MYYVVEKYKGVISVERKIIKEERVMGEKEEKIFERVIVKE